MQVSQYRKCLELLPVQITQHGSSCNFHDNGGGGEVVGCGFQPALDTSWLGSTYLDSFLLHFRLVWGARWGGGVRTLVAVDAVLALSAGLTGRPAEAPPTLTHACAIDSVQADPISEADVLRFPWARLALGAKVARAAFSCLKQKGQAGWGQGHTAVLWTCPATVWTSCRRDWMRARSLKHVEWL